MLIVCPSCNRQFKTTADLSGVKAKCGWCKHRFIVPDNNIVDLSEYDNSGNKTRHKSILQRISYTLNQTNLLMYVGLACVASFWVTVGMIILADMAGKSRKIPHDDTVAIANNVKPTRETEQPPASHKTPEMPAIPEVKPVSTTPQLAAESGQKQVKSGMNAVVNTDMFAATSYAAHDKLSDCLRIGDEQGAIKLASSGDIIALDKGQTVYVLRMHFFTSECRVLSGIGTGLEVVIPHEFLAATTE